MTNPPPDARLIRRLRLSGLLLVLGLLVQAATLLAGTTPPSFLVFALLGVPLTLAGMALYLFAIAVGR